MKKTVIQITTLHCRRCGHSWVPTKIDIRICPRCKSARWDEPREHVTNAQPKKGKKS
jgi:predicted Zn-ribbon and HTH transcriptional regulator